MRETLRHLSLLIIFLNAHQSVARNLSVTIRVQHLDRTAVFHWDERLQLEQYKMERQCEIVIY